MNEVYRSPYEAYPFLSDRTDDLRCDFELLTDEMASGTGLLHARVRAYMECGGGRDAGTCDESGQSRDELHRICDELCWICEMIYHINPTLRTRLTVTEEECDRLREAVDRLQAQVQDSCGGFVLPAGGEPACEAHLLRVQAKKLVRLIYRHIEMGNEVPDLLLDITNLLSGYFFYLALWLNRLEGVEEIPFVSRNYQKS